MNVQEFETKKGTFMTIVIDNSVVLGWFSSDPAGDRDKIREIGPDIQALRQWQRESLIR